MLELILAIIGVIALLILLAVVVIAAIHRKKIIGALKAAQAMYAMTARMKRVGQ